MAAFPTLAEIARIVAVTDPVQRNLQITQAYYELSQAIAEALGPSANWCAYATWASKQAGQTIRQEDLARALAERFNSPEAAEAFDKLTLLFQKRPLAGRESETRKVLRETLHPQAVLDRTSAAVAEGNRMVFEEIGREFARFLPILLNHGSDESVVVRFCDQLRPGEPPDGQGHLRSAFLSGWRASRESDPRKRAEWILLLNLEVGFHEQTRLQPLIQAALDAPIADARELRRRLLERLHPRLSVFRRLLDRYLVWTSPIDRFWGRATELARVHARQAVTECLMTLRLADETLHLGRDLRSEFPASLRHVTNRALLAILARLDPTPDSSRESGAVDWADFNERMHYVVDYFRSYQERPTLMRAPFSPGQVERIKQGEVPEGPL